MPTNTLKYFNKFSDMLILEIPIQNAILEDAAAAYPDECCGFLFGTESENERMVSEIMMVDNAKEGDKRRRFEISPRDYLRAENYARKTGQQLLGVYHSHPNHPAIPSEHDRVAAQPYFSYVIASYYERGRTQILSWRLNEEHQFEPELFTEQTLVSSI